MFYVYVLENDSGKFYVGQTEEAVRSYVGRERPLDCAGAFMLEGLGPALMAYARGDDFSAVVGLPLMALVHLLDARGVPVLGPVGG